MPSASPLVSPSPRPTGVVTVVPPSLWPTLGPSYPNAGAAGVLAIALAYFSLGVAVGALLKQSPIGRRWLPFVVVPGILAGLGFIAWVVRSLR